MRQIELKNLPHTKSIKKCPIPLTPLKNLKTQKMGKFGEKARPVVTIDNKKMFKVNASCRPILKNRRSKGASSILVIAVCFTHRQCSRASPHQLTFLALKVCLLAFVSIHLRMLNQTELNYRHFKTLIMYSCVQFPFSV